jgi:hypothetical protein
VEVCTDGRFENPDKWVSPVKIVVNAVPSFSAPPEVLFKKEEKIVTITYQATDPDNDPLTAAVKDPPPGAAIDASIPGQVTVNLAEVQPGRYSINLVVSDGQGGAVTHAQGITVTK